MQRLELSGAVRSIYGSLGVKRLTNNVLHVPPWKIKRYLFSLSKDSSFVDTSHKMLTKKFITIYLSKAAEGTCFTLSERLINHHQIGKGQLITHLAFHRASGPCQTQSIVWNYLSLMALKFMVFLTNYYFRSQEKFHIIIVSLESDKGCFFPFKWGILVY